MWLHSTVVPTDGHRKLHHPWTGPLKVIKKLSNLNYQIQLQGDPNQRSLIVHFNRLKKCIPGTRFDSTPLDLPVPPPTHAVGDGAVLLDLDEDMPPVHLIPPAVAPPPHPPPPPLLPHPPPPLPPRYPSRTHRPPTRLGSYVTY